MAEVQLSEIAKQFGEKRVLDRLSLSVPSGRYLVLLGKSGCGKTTLLKIIAGLEAADAGRVTIGDRDMSGVPPRQRNVAMVFQGDALYPHLTIRQSLSLGLKRTLPGQELRRRIDEATELVGIAQILDRKPHALSGGEQRRAAVAKAIVRRCAVRLLDEPLSALDANVRYEIGESLLRWHEKYPGTTIHVTHDGQEAMRMADEIAVIDDGRIVQCASPQAIYDTPVSRTVALSVGSPLISFVQARLDGGHLNFAGDEIKTIGERYLFNSKDRPVSVGVRAQAFRVENPAVIPQQSGVSISGKVLRTKMIDGRQIIQIVAGGALIDAESVDQLIAAGSDVTVFAAADQLHVFDQISGQRLQARS